MTQEQMINPTIQDRAMQSADQYWQKVLRVKELRVLYGLQNPRNNKPLISSANTITNYRPVIGKGWSKESDPEYHGIGIDGKNFNLVIRNDQLVLQEITYTPESHIVGKEYPVFTAPADIKTKTKRVKFLQAVGYTLITDPDNIRAYLPGVPTEITRFNIPAAILLPEACQA